MERIPNPKGLPGQFPVVDQVSHLHENAIRGEDFSNTSKSQPLDSAYLIKAWKAKNSFKSFENFVPGAVPLNQALGQKISTLVSLPATQAIQNSGASHASVTSSISVTSKSLSTSGVCDEAGPSLFSGASHPPEPVDSDLMGTVYVAIDQNKSKTERCLMKSLSIKGPFLEDLSVKVPNMKPNAGVFSPPESLIEEPRTERCLMKSLSFQGPFLEDLSVKVPNMKPNAGVFSPPESLIEEPRTERCLMKSLSIKGPFLEDLSVKVPNMKPNACVFPPPESLIEEPRTERCLMKSLSIKGPFLEDLSVKVPNMKPNASVFSPPESLIEEPRTERCLMKSLSIKGPFQEDLSVKVPNVKPNASVFSPPESLIEEPSELAASPSMSMGFGNTVLLAPFSTLSTSQSTENTLLVQDSAPPSSSESKENQHSYCLPESDEKECVWDASLPPSGNVSPHSSIDSIGVVTAMSIVNSCASAYRSDGITSDGMLSVDRNCESGKGSVRGDSLESEKSSISRASDSSGLSDDSNWSNITGSANKPHKGNDPRWKAILAVRARDGILGMSHFRLLKRLGCGDIGSVYLSELSGTRCYFAMKVMDKASLASRKKLTRAQTEREILQLLDHPFLPTLYTHFETDRFTCLVMEFCPGGDLHTLRQRQPGKHFSEYAARFYAAEVLLALEYLHMLGVVYRDLKPENVLVREDGHIMLSDFDLSLRCAVSPTLIKSSSMESNPSNRAFCVQPACIEPSSVCIQPACFIPRIFPQKSKNKTRKSRLDFGPPVTTLPELVAEPTAARSMSFVGTHEYLAPEIIKGEGHGSAVDWWTFGIFLHELLYGKTPFKGSGNRATLFNVVGQQLRFPDSPATSYSGRDLIRGLLVKEPQHRLGVKRGATEIKQHPFFEGVNWALIRCSTPPEVPKPVETELPVKSAAAEPVAAFGMGSGGNSKRMVGTDVKSGGKYLDFEFF